MRDEDDSLGRWDSVSAWHSVAGLAVLLFRGSRREDRGVWRSNGATARRDVSSLLAAHVARRARIRPKECHSLMSIPRTWRCARCGWLSPSDASACASCAKSRPREKAAPPPPSFRPWRCVVLALDAGECSGWSVHVLGKLASSGEFSIYTDEGVREVLRVVDTAKTFAASLRVPWVAMHEATWGGHMGLATPASVGYWTFALRNAQLPRARIGEVYPARWRARMLPRGMHAAKRDDVRVCEQATAHALVGRMVGADEAPAILIGKWATQAGEVGELLPKNARVTM